MADSIEIANYKKSVNKALDRYKKAIDAAEAEIVRCVAALKKLGVKDPLKELDSLLKDKDKNKQAAAKKIADSKTAIVKAGDNLKLDLVVIPAPASAPPKELEKLPAWLESLLKDATVKLSKNAKVKLNVKVKYDNKWKLKELGLQFTWNW